MTIYTVLISAREKWEHTVPLAVARLPESALGSQLSDKQMATLIAKLATELSPFIEDGFAELNLKFFEDGLPVREEYWVSATAEGLPPDDGNSVRTISFCPEIPHLRLLASAVNLPELCLQVSSVPQGSEPRLSAERIEEFSKELGLPVGDFQERNLRENPCKKLPPLPL